MSQADCTSLAAAASAALIALVFVRAAGHKLHDLESFDGLVSQYRVAPGWATHMVSRGIVVAEVSVAVALLAPRLQRTGAAVAFAMLLIYSTVMAANIVRGRRHLDCGCGGAPQKLSWPLVARNLGLSGVAALVILPGQTRLSFGEAAAALMSAVILWVGFLLVEQLLANAARIGPDGKEASG